MKQTMKKCLTLLLALLFTMAVPAAAATPDDKTITFTDVAQGDTVKAYQVMKYDANTTPTYSIRGLKKPLASINRLIPRSISILPELTRKY